MFKKLLCSCAVFAAMTIGACSSGSSSSSNAEMPMADDSPTAEPDANDPPDDSPELDNTNTDPTDNPNPDTNDSNQTPQPGSLAAAIQGAWMGSCSNFESQGISVRQINAVSDSQIILDFYEYDGNGCTGVPRGKLYPLRLYDYLLGSDVAADDGITAAQLDLTIKQISNAAYLRDGAQVDLKTYDIIGVDSAGNLLNTRADSRSIENRPTSFDNALLLSPRMPLTPASVTAEDLVGTYSPGCQLLSVGSSLVTETLDVNGKLTTVEEFHFNDTCSGEPDAATQRITQYVYGDSKTSIFGDTYIQVISTQNPKTILYGEEALSSLSLGETKVRYDAVSLVDDTLIRGDCVVRVDACKQDANHYSDMLDFEFNSSVRYKRVQP